MVQELTAEDQDLTDSDARNDQAEATQEDRAAMRAITRRARMHRMIPLVAGSSPEEEDNLLFLFLWYHYINMSVVHLDL